MPTYAYICANGHKFEEFQSIVALPIDSCPVCGAHAEREISGGMGLIFKGSGFYITDYAKKSSSGDSGVKSTSPAAKSDTKESKDVVESTKPDSKPSSDSSSDSKS